MIYKIKVKIAELEKDYDYWLERYDNDGLEYQEDRLKIIRAKIDVLNELINNREGDKE